MSKERIVTRLNPCCNGRWSRTNKAVTKRDAYRSLNPCCNGRWSRTVSEVVMQDGNHMVLILVVMEDGLVRRQRTT